MSSLYHYNYTTCTSIYDTKLITSLYGCFPIENTKLIT